MEQGVHAPARGARVPLARSSAIPAAVRPGAVYRISDLELASRLSFFLWSSIPDEELLDVAERGQLRDPGGAGRAGAPDAAPTRASQRSSNFAGQWLFLRNLAAVVPVQQSFPDFDDTLRQAFRRETELFFESIVREDRSALDLLRPTTPSSTNGSRGTTASPNVKGSHSGA